MSDDGGDRLARGMATAMKLFPPGSPGPRFQYPKEIVEDWNRFSISTVMGDVWGREAIEPKHRAMITIAVLAALGRPDQLRTYVGAGLNLGLTREEICEIILHVSVYAGFPSAIQAFGIVNEAFEAIDAADAE